MSSNPTDPAVAEPSQVPPSSLWWKNPKLQRWAIFSGVVLAVYGLIYLDVVSRAKEAVKKGDQFMDWAENPDKKKAYFDAQFEAGKKKLNEEMARKSIAQLDYDRKLDLLTFDRNNAMEESSLKYAYQWYKDAYELFSPPESKWVKMARTKSQKALALWKAELDAQKIPYQDYMFE